MSASKSNEMIVLSTIVVILLGITTGMPAGSATRDPAPITFNSPNAQPDGYFGFSVAVSGASVVVGAPYDNAGVESQAGHAYIFSSTGSLIATLTSPNAQTGGRFGASVAMSGRRVIVGAPWEAPNGQFYVGHAYICTATECPPTGTLTSPNAQTQGWFGNSVAISGMTGEVGAPYEA